MFSKTAQDRSQEEQASKRAKARSKGWKDQAPEAESRPGPRVCGMHPCKGAAATGAEGFEMPIAWLQADQRATACELAAAAKARSSRPVGPDIVSTRKRKVQDDRTWLNGFMANNESQRTNSRR